MQLLEVVVLGGHPGRLFDDEVDPSMGAVGTASSETSVRARPWPRPGRSSRTTPCPTAPIEGSTSSSKSRPGWPPQDDYLQQLHTDVLPTLVYFAAWVGALAFGTTAAIRRPSFSPGRYRITTCDLDDDPATVGERLAPVLKRICRRTGPAGARRSLRIDDDLGMGPLRPPRSAYVASLWSSPATIRPHSGGSSNVVREVELPRMGPGS